MVLDGLLPNVLYCCIDNVEKTRGAVAWVYHTAPDGAGTGVRADMCGGCSRGRGRGQSQGLELSEYLR